MINFNKLVSMARKWMKLASIGRKRISLQEIAHGTSLADEGHFVVYTSDNTRFMIPLEYLANSIFRELLKMAEEEVGITSNGPITLPCDVVFMKYILSLVRRRVSEDMEHALLISMATARCQFLLFMMKNKEVINYLSKDFNDDLCSQILLPVTLYNLTL